MPIFLRTFRNVSPNASPFKKISQTKSSYITRRLLANPHAAIGDNIAQRRFSSSRNESNRQDQPTNNWQGRAKKSAALLGVVGVSIFAYFQKEKIRSLFNNNKVNNFPPKDVKKNFEELQNSDLIFVYRNAILDHVMIYHQFKVGQQEYNIAHVVLAGLMLKTLESHVKNRLDLEEKAKKDKCEEYYEYDVFRFSDPSYKAKITDQVNYFSKTCISEKLDGLPLSDTIRYANYRLCAYQILPELSPLSEAARSKSNKVAPWIYGTRIEPTDFFNKKNNIDKSNHIKFLQYCKYSNRYNSLKKPHEIPPGKMTCTQFVLLCLTIPRIRECFLGDDCRLTDLIDVKNKEEFIKEPLTEAEIVTIIEKYNNERKSKDLHYKKEDGEKLKEGKSSKSLAEIIDGTDAQDIEKLLGSFLQLSPKTVTLSELYKFLDSNKEELHIKKGKLLPHHLKIDFSDSVKPRLPIPKIPIEESRASFPAISSISASMFSGAASSASSYVASAPAGSNSNVLDPGTGKGGSVASAMPTLAASTAP